MKPKTHSSFHLVTLKQFGIGVKWVTEHTPEAFAAAIDEKTKAIYIESIANPKYRVFDIPAIAKVWPFFYLLLLIQIPRRLPTRMASR